MPQKVYKTIPKQVADMTLNGKNKWNDTNLSHELFTSLKEGGLDLYPGDVKNNYSNVRGHIAKRLTELFDIDDAYAQILADGAFSRPQTQSALEKGKSYGIFESEPMNNQVQAIKDAESLLSSNKDKWGVLYGYRANGGLHRLKNPIYVNTPEEIDKYQNAIGHHGNDHLFVEMQGRFRRG